MNILVLGNGFDLAHGLPTKYTDFLKFVEVVRQLLNAKNKENINIDKDIHPTISSLIKREVFPREQEWAALLEENFWVDYFLQCPMYQKENWIDFESEIGNVIRSIDIDMKNNNVQLDDDASVISNKYLEQFFS